MSIISFKDKIREQLTEKVAELEGRYVTIEDMHEELNQMELQNLKKEKEYNNLLKKYIATLPDINEVEMIFLEYSTEARLRLEADGGYRIDITPDIEWDNNEL